MLQNNVYAMMHHDK